uniref:Uncharacterized protein n=1 Tax=Anguilla anguilla TaxID=7936 RepID=A0A0E9TCR2_ANGAN
MAPNFEEIAQGRAITTMTQREEKLHPTLRECILLQKAVQMRCLMALQQWAAEKMFCPRM